MHCVRVRGRTNRLETGQTRTVHTSFSTSSCRECPSGRGRTCPVVVSAVSCVRDREVRNLAVAYLSNQLLVPPQRAVVAMDRSRTVVRLQIHERHVSSVPCMEEVRLPSQTVNVPIGQVTHTPSTSVLPAVQY